MCGRTYIQAPQPFSQIQELFLASYERHVKLEFYYLWLRLLLSYLTLENSRGERKMALEQQTGCFYLDKHLERRGGVDADTDALSLSCIPGCRDHGSKPTKQSFTHQSCSFE